MRGAVICLVLIMSICIVSAEHIVETYDGENSFLVDEGDDVVFNISIKNTDVGNSSNITQVEITLPTQLDFEANSEGTDAPFTTFTDTTPDLVWTNNSGLINTSKTKYFWFTAQAETSGNYTITITTTNSTGSLSTDLALRITSTSNCTSNVSCTSWTACADGRQTRNCTDLNSCVANSSSYKDCNCTSNWQCTDWSDCLGGTQIRSCIDNNLCGDNSTKPDENQTCIMCTTNWNCTSWIPEKCSSDELQSRECTDSNSCGTITGKPEDSRACEYTSFFSFGPIVFMCLIAIIISLMAGDVILMYKQWRKINPKPPASLQLAPIK